MSAADTMDVADLASGKGHKDENFPVASVLIAPRFRAPVMAFYHFARAADDVSDNAATSPEHKLALLESMRATLVGESDANAESLALRRVQQEYGLNGQHALDLLEAFRRDCTKLRYANWAGLMDYCRYSAAPVGRFVLDVHGESAASWPANDALCSALQVINHLQDCGKDLRDLDRCYIPLDQLAQAGATVEDLRAPAASPALRGVIADLARRTDVLLAQSRHFSDQVDDTRLALEVAVIQGLAQDLNTGLMRRDPLSQPVHHGKPQALGLALLAAVRFAIHRPARRKSGRGAPASIAQ